MIVESKIEKDQFLEYWNNEESIVIPIWEDLERHPMTCDVSFLYVRFQNLDFVLPFNHNDCEPIEIDLSKSKQTKWKSSVKICRFCHLLGLPFFARVTATKRIWLKV